MRNIAVDLKDFSFLTELVDGNIFLLYSINYYISAKFVGSTDGRLHALSFDMLQDTFW